MTKASVLSFPVIKNSRQYNQQTNDLVAVEEPLEIIVEYGPQDQRLSEKLAVTMRTPGSDLELVAGFLAAEKIINDPVYGFITIPSELIFDIIETKVFQRLRRINQMGLYPLSFSQLPQTV